MPDRLCQARSSQSAQQVTGTQLGQLAAFAEDPPQVTARVLPFSTGAHAGSGAGPLAVRELVGLPSPGVVHLGGLYGGGYLADRAAVTATPGSSGTSGQLPRGRANRPG